MKIFKTSLVTSLSLILCINSVLAGIGDFSPARTGISAELNQGVGNSIQFNRYHDQPHLAQIRGWLPWNIDGNARYAAIRARGVGAYDDERDFVTAAKDYTNTPNYAYGNGNRIYKHTLTGLGKGDIVRLFTYVHNNAIQGCGGINIARDTKVTFDWNNPQKVISTISASNSLPRVISDIVDLRYTGNYTLEYINKTVIAQKRFPDQYPVGHPSYGVCSNGSNMSWNHGTIGGTRINANKISINLGSVAGSSGNARWIVSYFRVVDNQIPSIKIEKDDSTFGTNDSDAGHDKQEVSNGGTAHFTIKATNNGQENLKEIYITDSLAPNCSLSKAQALVKIQAIGNRNSTFDVGESFTYTCTDENVTAGYTNIANIYGNSVVDNQAVLDTDPTVIILKPNAPAININKDDSTPGTVDTDGNDTQMVNFGTQADFTIKVTNTGQESLKNVRVEDPLAPSCNLSISEALVKIRSTGNNDGIFNPGESFTYTCSDPRVIAGYQNTAIVYGNSILDDDPVTDNDPTIIVINPNGPQPAININKDDSTPGTADTDGNDIQKIAPSANATANFTIKVTNTGEVDLKDIIVADVLSPNCERSAIQTEPLILEIGNKDKIFNRGETFTYTCTHTPVTESFTNIASVIGTPVNGQPNVTDSDPSQVILEIKGGGGGGNIISAIGTCSVTNGNYQCVPRRPVEDPSDELWVIYNECRNTKNKRKPKHTNANTLEKNCALDWAASQDFNLCGVQVGGATGYIDYFGRATNADTQAQCDIIVSNPPIPSLCNRQGSCPECFNANAKIKKEITSKTMVAKGEKVTYEVTVENLIYSYSNHDIVEAKIRVYDMIIPAESGNIWDRKGIIDGDGNRTWIWHENEKYFERNLTSAELNNLNSHGAQEFKVHYDMNTSLAAKEDTSQIKNVAFAVINYKYKNIDSLSSDFGNVYSKTIRIGKNTCNPQYYAYKSISSLGSIAEVKIIRPFVEAKNGNIGIRGTADENITSQRGMKTFGGDIITDINNNRFGSESKIMSGDEFKNLSKYNNSKENDIYLANKEQNTSKIINVGSTQLKTHDYGSNVYFIKNTQSLKISDLKISSEFDKSTTFILEEGDLLIDENFRTTGNKFFAFIVRKGNILIDPSVDNINGIFIAEKGKVKSINISTKTAEISSRKLKVSGSLIGNLRHLLSFRKFIGTSDAKLEPSISVNFDIRLLEATPPILERFLGRNWKEEV